MKYLTLIVLAMLLFSCSDEEKFDGYTEHGKKEEKPTEVVNKASLVEIENGTYIEYYEDGKTIKFKGPQDEELKRHGKWSYYGLDGKELSTTMYSHGQKHGHSIVKYPNGTLRYVGEYHFDNQIGIWKSYDKEGKLIEEKDYGQPSENN